MSQPNNNQMMEWAKASIDQMVEEARIIRRANRATLTTFLLLGLFILAINSSWMLENGYITDNKYEVWYPDTFVEVAFMLLCATQWPAIYAGMKLRSKQSPRKQNTYF